MSIVVLHTTQAFRPLVVTEMNITKINDFFAAIDLTPVVTFNEQTFGSIRVNIRNIVFYYQVPGT